MKKLKINELEVTLQTLNKIADRMIELGIEIESIFPTVHSNPNIETIKKILSDGDTICEDLKTNKEQLEKLRKHLI